MKVTKWWWAWSGEKIERWLEQKAAEGYLLKSSSWGGMVLEFEKVAPVKMSYSVDFRLRLSAEYLSLIHEDGWKMIPAGFGWYIFRKEYRGARPRLFSDLESMYRRYLRLTRLLTAVLAAFVIVALASLLGPGTQGSGRTIIYTVYGACVLVYLLLIWRLVLAANAVRREQKMKSA